MGQGSGTPLLGESLTGGLEGVPPWDLNLSSGPQKEEWRSALSSSESPFLFWLSLPKADVGK